MSFERGSVVMDTARSKLGTYMDTIGTQVHIRPLGGGREWTADPTYVRAATPLECAKAQAILLNRAMPIPRP